MIIIASAKSVRNIAKNEKETVFMMGDGKKCFSLSSINMLH